MGLLTTCLAHAATSDKSFVKNNGDYQPIIVHLFKNPLCVKIIVVIHSPRWKISKWILSSATQGKHSLLGGNPHVVEFCKTFENYLPGA